MSIVRKLVYFIGMRADTSGAKQAQAAADRTSQSWDKLTQVVNRAGLAIIGAGSALGYLVANTAHFAEEVERSARGLDMSITQYQEYKAAFDALGASTDDLMDAMVTVADRAVDAMEGNKEYAKEFKRVGIAIDELRGKKGHEIFDMFIDRSTKVKDALQVQTAAARLFGDDLGRRILPVMVQSAESFASLRQLVRDTGLGLDDLAIKKLRTTAFEMRRTEFITKGLARDLAGELAPAMTEVAKGVGDILTERAPGLMKFFDEAGKEALNWANKFVLAMKDINAAAGDDAKLGQLADVLYRLGLILGAGIAGVSVVAGVGLLASTLSGLTLPAIAAFMAISSLVRYFEDLWVAAHEGDSLIGSLGSKFDWLTGILQVAKEMVLATEADVEEIKVQFRELFAVFTDEGEEGFSMLEVMLAAAHAALTAIVVVVLGLVRFFLFLTKGVMAFGIATARVFQTALLHWDKFKSYFVDSAKEVLALFERMFSRFYEFGRLTGAITGEEVASIGSSSPGSIEAERTRAEQGWSKGLSVLGNGTANDLANLYGRGLGMDTSGYERLGMQQQLYGAAEDYRFGNRVQARQPPANVDTRIGQVNINLPNINTDNPEAWGKAAATSFQSELISSEEVYASGVP